VLITAGPTHEPIDPVRYIANHSSGKQGYALAEAAVALGCGNDPRFRAGLTAHSRRACRCCLSKPHATCSKACEEELPADIAIFAAAVADWRVESVADEKMKKTGGGPPVAVAG
jgi:phosphopantothenoylcysteine decarboxylase / phosphopantothenate---cysteine ligase